MNIKVIGIGGCGCNIVKYLIENNTNIETICLNTNIDSLNNVETLQKIELNINNDSYDIEDIKNIFNTKTEQIKNILKDTDILIITAGMGGRTGSVLSYYIAKIAKDMGIFTMSFVTLPFKREGQMRMKIAKTNIKQLKDISDITISINNQKLLFIIDENTSKKEAYDKINDALHIVINYLININDLEKIKQSLSDKLPIILINIKKLLK